MSRIEIYTVTYNFNRWYYTSADENHVENVVTYRAVPIRRSGVELNSDPGAGEFEIEVPLDVEFLELFRVSPPSGMVTLLCQSFDSATPDQKSVIFKGSVVNVKWELESATVLCETSSQAIRRMGLRRHYQYGCPHMLYGGECNVNRNDFLTLDVASNVTGTSVDLVAAAGKPDDWFAGGYIEYTHSELQTIERISVGSSVGANGRLNLFSYPVGLAGGAEVRAYAGCNRTIQQCTDKFDNAINYGGMPFIPTKNPFGGDPVF
jgi:uncharacterized phage protein (TIGR02218 family)